MINLDERRQEIVGVATKLFKKFVSMPKDVRPDDKERTGIQVIVWEPGTRNLVMGSIEEPSEAARFFAIEKAVRSHMLSDMSSGNSANPDSMEFAGSVSIFYSHPEKKGEKLQEGILRVSTSGLTAEEDVAVSVSIIARIIGCSFAETCQYIQACNGKLPAWYEEDNKGYFQFLFE
ncbi:MAG: hypothetical protein PHE20_02655 [Patescibacteria group bacterium]|nr:hypothetical protein [Patescibacteria group bacterium]